MEKGNRSTLEYIMHYGALLGLFWMFKYLFKIGESYWVHFIYPYSLLHFISPILMYVFYVQYMTQTPEIKHTMWKCIVFVVGISFLGSFFEGAIMYAHFTLINPDVFANISALTIAAYESFMKLMDESGYLKDKTAEEVLEMKSQLEMIGSSKVLFIAGNMMNHVFSGLLFSVIIGLLTKNRINHKNK